MITDILIVDDDRDLAGIMKDMLEDYGYQVACCASSEEAYTFLEQHKAKLMILDINMPGDNGFEVCTELRKISTVPVIFVSARTSEDDRIRGLDLGADDYLGKPFSLKELLSRVKANLRRAYGFDEEEKVYQIGAITVEPSARKVKKNGQELSLSLREYDLLLYFLENPGIALSKEKLLSEVWGTFSQIEPATLAVHIRWLREKIEDDPGQPRRIQTVWGIGYQWNQEN